MEQAFDSTSHHSIVDALIATHVPSALILGIMEEYDEAKVTIALDNMEMGKVRIEKGLCIGSLYSSLE